MNYKKKTFTINITLILSLDFEAILSKIDDNGSKTHTHVPICYAWKLTSTIKGETTNTRVYTGLDCVEVFVNDMIELYDSVSHYFYMNKPIKMTMQNELDFKEAVNCYICGKKFTEDTKKARDHNHVTGK